VSSCDGDEDDEDGEDDEDDDGAVVDGVVIDEEFSFTCTES